MMTPERWEDFKREHEARRAPLHDIDRGLLFEPPVTLSPFEAWKREHGVSVYERKCHCVQTGECECETDYLAFVETEHLDDPFLDMLPQGFHASELEACYALAREMGLVWFQTGKVAI